jgi:hypothetical protein
MTMTYGQSMKRNVDLRALGHRPVATYSARHAADAHARRIGGEVLIGPGGLDVFAPLFVAVEAPQGEPVRLFEPAPTPMPGQTTFSATAAREGRPMNSDEQRADRAERLKRRTF